MAINKTNRVTTLGHWFKGPVTNQAVLDSIPQSVWNECPSRIVAEVGDAINKAYNTRTESDEEYIACLKEQIQKYKGE